MTGRLSTLTALLLGLLGVGGVLALGGERYRSLPATVEAEWSQRAERALQRELPQVLARWEAVEAAALSGGAPARERFLLGPDRRPREPRPYATAFASAEIAAPNPPAPAALARARALAGGAAPEGRRAALRAYRLAAAAGPLPDAALLGYAGTAAGLGETEVAIERYRELLERESHAAPWIRALAASRLADCLLAANQNPEAATLLARLADELLDRAGRKHAGLTASRRFFLARRALDRLAEVGSPPRELRAQLAQREREEALLEAIATRIGPWLAGASLPARAELQLDGQPDTTQRVLVIAHRREDGTIAGVLCDPDAFRAEVSAALPALGADLALELPSGSSPDPAHLSAAPLAPGSTIRVAVRARLEARAAELSARRLNLGLILVLVAGGLLLGNVFVLARLRREVRVSQLKSDLLANVSHDLRTPLAVIRSAAETLQLGRTDPEKAERYLWVIVEETIRLDALVANVLDAARIELGRKDYDFQELDPADLVRDLEARWRSYLERAGFELVVKCAEVPPVRADESCLRTALSNLIENAMKYSEATQAIEVELAARGERIELSVSDRGQGVDERELTRIFERHYRAEASALSTEGLGLGLALVVETARAHAGSVRCEARAGGGSRFVLSLPSLPPNAEPEGDLA